VSISIIIPTLNEQDNVQRIYKTVVNIFNEINIDWEIIFVDDKSEDQTQLLIKKLPQKKKITLIESQNRLGLGNAISIGWKNANLDYVLFLDCDSHVSIKDLLQLIKSRSPDSVVIGSRYLKKSKINGAPYIKVFLSKILNKLVGFILNINIIDMSHSLRILPNKYVNISEVLTHPGYFWALTKKFKKLNFKLLEIPITFNERELGSTKNTSFKMIKSVISSLYIISKI
tara:strand:+ start:2163 stop:2849 length:687 start_codon:yes stop_codon:yes gene_type:complete